MTDTFLPPENPSYGLMVDHEFNVNVARFGDNYSQRMRKGINSTREVWQLAWEDIERYDALTIEAFLKAKGAVDVFWWTQPPPYPTDLPGAFVFSSSTITIGGVPLTVRSAANTDLAGRKLFRCTKLNRTYSSPLTDTVRATFEQEFDLGAT